MDSGANTVNSSAANHLIEGLLEAGIEYVFSNMGTDHAPIIEALAGRKRRGQPVPKIITCPHENTAAHMAGGYALATGRGQGVLVHVDVGTANTANAMHNLFRSRLPVLLMAGRAPFTTHGELTGTRDNYVHFVQEPFDQAALVRPYTKWEWTLPSGVVAKETLRRAHTIMHTEPKGPVYLMLPREILTEVWSDQDVRSYPAERFGAPEPSGADPQLVERLADALLASANPILLASYAGRTAGSSEAIFRLAESAGIRVFEANMVSNIAHDGPCFAGFAPGPAIAQADFGLMVDVDVPYFPRDTRVNEAIFWAQIDVDVVKGGSPMWSFPSNLRLQGNSARILAQLLEAVQRKASSVFRQAAAARVAQMAADKIKRDARVAELAQERGKPGAINAHYLCAELGKRIAPEDVICAEAARNSPAVTQQIPRPVAGTLARVGGGGLGSSGGMALGMRLACPDRLAIQIVGDGSFYFNVPSSVFAASKQHNLPIFTLILDNGGWSAVKESTLRVYPDGDAKAEDSFEAELPGDVDFSKIGEAFGAYGEKLTDPNEVPAAIERCLKAVRGGRTAVLHACVTRL
ncbi:MAG TPA: thiamine pyrophosphate-requiring protein [Xanthobacteraceae bacterium]|jgi:acetolactate synthase-1/2/3 large subunit|nr:thiamine pyrophosphate-requiring protein [Xanthobacteraceae bacterium]